MHARVSSVSLVLIIVNATCLPLQFMWFTPRSPVVLSEFKLDLVFWKCFLDRPIRSGFLGYRILQGSPYFL